MDLGLLLQVLPLALGAAMSPTVLMIQLLLLADGAVGLQRAWAFAVGRTLGLIVISLGGYSLLARLPDFDTGLPSGTEGLFACAGGVALLLVGVREYRRGPRSDTSHQGAERLQRLPPWTLAPVGLFWQFVNVTTLALFLPALHVITSAAAPLLTRIVALGMLIAITSIAWIGPPLLVTWRGDQARRWLDRLHDWLADHSHQLTLGITTLFGVALLGWGAAILLTNT